MYLFAQVSTSPVLVLNFPIKSVLKSGSQSDGWKCARRTGLNAVVRTALRIEELSIENFSIPLLPLLR